MFIKNLPGARYADWMGSSGSIMPYPEEIYGSAMGVLAAEAWMGMGITAFDKRVSSSLMSAMKAGTLTG